MPAHARQSKVYMLSERDLVTLEVLMMSLNESCEKYFQITVYIVLILF